MKRASVIVACVAVITAVALGWWWMTPTWPQFPSEAGNAPQPMVQVDRDYAYHVGDLIPVDLYIKQKANTKVEPSTFEVDGDFELAAKPDVSSKQLKDGSVVYHLALKLQSFAVKPELVVNGSIGWQVGDEDHQMLKLPPVSLFWSNTWDGRPNLKEGISATIPFAWYGGRFIIALTASSLLFTVLLASAVVRYVRTRPGKKVDHARNRVVELLERIKAGSSNQEDHFQLDGLLRDHFEVGPIPAGSLDPKYMVLGLATFLKLNDPAIYSREPLSEQDRAQLYELGQKILTVWKAP